MSIKRDDIFNATSIKNRTWWRNLKNGETANLHVSGKDVTVRGEVIEDSTHVAEELLGYFQHTPVLTKYFGIKTDPSGDLVKQDRERVAAERVFSKLILVR